MDYVLSAVGEPDSHFWALTRDGQAVAVVSIEGRFHRPGKPVVDLAQAYVKHHCRLRPMTVALLSDWLE
ncbi:hypothetical protein [Microbacterium sp. ZKA21]|uniref:TY-Chap2 family putative peptide chaperone n=1 Tax=Microbacterium sp. ZKA21 TaxID=3381694 RepID=UPI003D23C002